MPNRFCRARFAPYFTECAPFVEFGRGQSPILVPESMRGRPRHAGSLIEAHSRLCNSELAGLDRLPAGYESIVIVTVHGIEIAKMLARIVAVLDKAHAENTNTGTARVGEHEREDSGLGRSSRERHRTPRDNGHPDRRPSAEDPR